MAIVVTGLSNRPSKRGRWYIPCMIQSYLKHIFRSLTKWWGVMAIQVCWWGDVSFQTTLIRAYGSRNTAKGK